MPKTTGYFTDEILINSSQCITEQGVVIRKSALCICVIFVLPLVCISVTSHTNVSQGIAGHCNAESGLNVGQSVPSVMQLVT